MSISNIKFCFSLFPNQNDRVHHAIIFKSGTIKKKKLCLKEHSIWDKSRRHIP